MVEQQQTTGEDGNTMDENNEQASTELDEAHAMTGNEENEEDDSNERLVHVKSEQVEEDGIIEELYDVYEPYEGDIVADQPTTYEEGQAEDGGEEDMGANSISGLSADIEYLDQLDQDQLTESAQEDDIEMQNSSDEEFIPIKSRSVSTRSVSTRSATAGVKRRVNSRKATTGKSAGAKIKRETTTKIILNPDETFTFGETIVRKSAGIKTKGGHKILVGDKKSLNIYATFAVTCIHLKVALLSTLKCIPVSNHTNASKYQII